MLVLSRKLGEQIIVPTMEMTVTVLSINGKTVRLGFAAPNGVPVHRQEVWQRNVALSATGAFHRPSVPH
jgi:carbon storage regulator